MEEIDPREEIDKMGGGDQYPEMDGSLRAGENEASRSSLVVVPLTVPTEGGFLYHPLPRRW